MSDFENKNLWALILGGSSGIGLASARKLANHGFNLIIVHKDRRNTLEKVNFEFESIREMGVNLISFNQDAVETNSIKEISIKIERQLSKEDGKIKLLLHSVAQGNLKPLFKIEETKNTPNNDSEDVFVKVFNQQKINIQKGTLNLKDFDLTIHSMALSLLTWVNATIEMDLFSSNSRIIGLTSEGDKKMWGSYAAVATAKSALETLIKYIAVELAPRQITANLIQAGVTDTQSLKMIPGSDFIKSFTKERNPNKRLTTPEDIAGVVYLLCRKEASWINGTTIIADGGEHLI